MEIIWSNRARTSFLKVIDYLKSEWTQREVERFIRITDSHILLLGSGILRGRPTSKRENIFSVLLDKNNRLYYRVKKETIFLLEFWDTRRNPSKNLYE